MRASGSDVARRTTRIAYVNWSCGRSDVYPGSTWRSVVSYRRRLRCASMELGSVPSAPTRLSPPTPRAPLPRILGPPKVDPAQNSLPPQLTSFIGREREVAKLGHALETTRLV